MIRLLANAGSSLGSNLSTVLVALATALGAILTLAISALQFRRSAREQRQLERQAVELDRARGKALAEAVVAAAESVEHGSAPAEEGTSGTVVIPPLEMSISPRPTIDRNVGLSQQSAAVISLLAGTIIDAVAGLFFVQSGRAQRVMQEFFEKLRTDRKLDESLALAERVTDPELQGKLQVLLAPNFADVEASPDILSAILRLPVPNREHKAEKTTAAQANPPSA